MADKVVTKNVLQLVAEFNDLDTRTITLDNPRDTIDGAAINAVGAIAKTNNIIIGDKAGSNFERFSSAKKVLGTTTYLDLTEA